MDMKRGHRRAFIVEWEQLMQQYPRPTAEAAEERQAASAAGPIAAGHLVAAADDQGAPEAASHRMSAADGVAPVDAGQAAAAATPGAGVASLDTAECLGPAQCHVDGPSQVPTAMVAATVSAPAAVKETGRPTHAVATATHVASEPSTEVTARAVVPAEVPVVATAAPKSAPVREHRGPVDDAQRPHA